MQRFYSHVAPPNENGCRLWLLKPGADGYGWFNLNGRKVRAHVAVLILSGAEIPEGQETCHTCDVPMCVELTHLFPCTHAANMADKVAKGRQMRGAAHHLTHLTDEDVRFIRSSPQPLLPLARRYGVSLDTISRIRRRMTWKHVD